MVRVWTKFEWGQVSIQSSYIPQVSVTSAVSQPVSVSDDIQKMFEDKLAKQQADHKAEMEKLRSKIQPQKVQLPVSQTVEPVSQPKGPPSSLKTEEGLKNYYVAEYLKEVGLLNKEDLDSDYPVKPFQRPRPQRSNVSARIDRVEEGVNETRDAVNQLTNQFQKLNIRKCDICGATVIVKAVIPKDR